MYTTKALDEVHSRLDDFAGQDECCSWAAYDTVKALNNFILAVYHEAIHTKNAELLAPDVTEHGASKTKEVDFETNTTHA
jgi:hypothetical protein